MKGRCFNCGSSSHLRRDCTAKTSSTPTSTPAQQGGSAGDGSQQKKVSKVKAASKPSAKDSPGDSQKGKAANAGEMNPKEVVNTVSGTTSEGTQGGESTTTEPMGEPSTEAAAARGHKPLEVHQVIEGRADEVRGRRELWWTWGVRPS